MSSFTRRLFVGSAIAAAGAGRVQLAGAQTGTPSRLPAKLTAFLEKLVLTTPTDADGQKSLMEILGAGSLTTINEAQRTAAVSYLSSWTSAVTAIDAESVPPYAAKWHEEIASDIDSLSSSLEFSELANIPDMVTFSEIGLFAMLIGASTATD